MATWSSDLDDLKFGVIIQTEGHTFTPHSCNGPKEMEVFGSTPSHSPSQSLARKQTPDHPETWYCLKIQATSTKDRGTIPPPTHVWQAPVVEDMLWDGKSGLAEAVMTGPGRAILFYGRQSLGEGLSLGEVWDTTFMLSGAISWVGKQAQLNASAVSLWEGRSLIAQAITEWCIEARGPGHPQSCLPASPQFSFHNQDEPTENVRTPTADEWMEVPRHTSWASYYEWGQALQCSQNCTHRQWDPLAASTPSSSPSLDCSFESDRSSVSTSSSVSSRSNRFGGSRCWHCGQCCWQPRHHMKINLPVFRDEDKKDTVTYQSWHWDIMVYHQAGCWDCILLPYVICSLQGYLGELVRSLGPSITLDGVIIVLDEHYNNVKALDAMNQELFQLWMANKEMVSDWGCTSQDTSKSLQPHSWKGSQQTALLNQSETTSTMGCPSSWRWWWPTSRQLLMRRHTQTTFGWHKKQRRRKQWKPPRAQLWPAWVCQKWLASSLYGSSRAVSQP